MDGKVREWLEGEGYPLEMRAASAFRSSGFDVRQSVYYMDADTGKTREIDLLCGVGDFPYGLANLSLVVECKTSKKPWVVFSSEHTLLEFNRLFAFGILSGKVRGELANTVHDVRDRLSWFPKRNRRIGYAATQAFAEKQDVPFSAAMGTIKASLDLLKPSDGGTPPFRAAFPIIVLDAPLIDCFLDETGEVQLSEIDEHEFFFAPRLEDFPGTCIRIVTLRGLPSFCQVARKEMDTLLDVLKPAREREWEGLKRDGALPPNGRDEDG
jgi:hypothetical protein